MKKNVFMIAMILAGLFAFAENFKVKSVSGNVTYVDAKGKTVDIKEGMAIDSDVNVSTGLNSTLVVNHEGKDFSIKPMKKGKISELCATGKSKGGVKIGSKVTKSDIAQAAGKSSKGAATASSRASEAKSDVLWEE